MPRPRPARRSLPARWIWTNTWATVAALALHALAREIAGQTASIPLGMLIIGGVIGGAQGGLLTQALAAFSRRRWIAHTVVGVALVLLAGAAAVRSGLEINLAAFGGDEPVAAAQRAWSAVLLTQITGFLIGLLIGAPQARALVAPAGLRVAWVAANGAGWSLGMLLTVLPLGMVGDRDPRWILPALVAGLALTGLAVGLFTQPVLARLAIHRGASPHP